MDNFRYKPGDAYRVRPDLSYDTEYRMRSGPKENDDDLIIVNNMIDFAGKIVHISKYTLLNDYRIEEDAYRYRWTDDMFAGPADGVTFQSLL